MPRPSIGHVKTIAEIQKAISGFGDWSERYLFEGAYDLPEQYLQKCGFDYDAG